MGKITVKHYLNTRVSPLDLEDGKEYYPIYIQVTHKRRTTQIRSFTEIFCTIAGVEQYTQTGVFDNGELFGYCTAPGSGVINSIGVDAIGENGIGADTIKSLQNETRLIELGIKYIDEHGIDISKNGYDLRNVLTALFEPVSIILIKNFNIWVDVTHIEDDFDTSLYYAFNPRYTLSTNITQIKLSTDIDLTGFIDKKDWELSRDIDTFIAHIGAKTTYIDAIVNNDFTVDNPLTGIKNPSDFYEYLHHSFNMQMSEFKPIA